MSTKPARRGRPRKFPIAETTVKEKPKEERSFPDLNINEPLNLVHLKLILSTTTTKIADKALPLPSFKKIAERNKKATGTFQRPENHYIHYQEPSESELFQMVEYDMDEQDRTWLKILNKERKIENLGQVSNSLFEAIIDSLEKEWFNLTKHMPKRSALLPEDSTCAVCDDGECENSNAIVFCDGCNLAVHQECYGIPYIPEGQWLCRKCMMSPDAAVSCLFCPFQGGAFKQTTQNQWGHLLCAVWIPEVHLADSIYMEPIKSVEKIPKSRWKLNCYICRRRQGACIQCDNKQCFTAFHVTCARWARLCMRMNLHSAHHDGVALKAYCERHTPDDYDVDVNSMVEMAQQWFIQHKHSTPHKCYVDEEEQEDRQQAVVKLKKPHHQYTSSAPIAPDYILEKLESLPCVVVAEDLKNKSSLITSICRYWSLKRGARRGAPLLKRLNIESWNLHSKQTEVETSCIKTLRSDLENVRKLAGQVQTREGQKLERIQNQKAYLELLLYPIENIITPIIQQLIALDKKEFFRYPVTVDIASDYFEFIQYPMSFQDILDKLSNHQYVSLDEFNSDLSLIWSNCMSYNKAETAYYKQAEHLKSITEDLIREAQSELKTYKIKESTGMLDLDIDPAIFGYERISEVPLPTLGENEQTIVIADTVNDLSGEKQDLEQAAEETVDKSSTDKEQPNDFVVDESNKDEEQPKEIIVDEPSSKKQNDIIVEPSNEKPNNETVNIRTIEEKITVVVENATEGAKAGKKRRRNPDDVPTTRTKLKRVTHETRKRTLRSTAKVQIPPIIVKPAEKTRIHELDTPPPDVKFVDGEIVWARVPKFPSHPAKIVNPKVSKEDIPKHILLSKPKENKDIVLVKFFLVGETHTWSWVHKPDIQPLGYLAVDRLMLQKVRHTKKACRITEVRNAYRHVCDLLKVDPETALKQVFNRKK